MVPFPPHTRRHLHRTSAIALAVAGALGIAGAALAQAVSETADLRGAVAENVLGGDRQQQPRETDTQQTRRTTPTAQTRPAAEEGIPSPAYQPATQRTLDVESDTALDDPLAERQPDLNIFDDEVVTGPAATRSRTAERTRPQTAAQRRQQPAGVATPRDAATARRQAEDEMTTGTVREPRLDAIDEARNERAETDNSRSGPVEGLGRRPEDDPYAPVGLRLGTFNLTTRLDQGIGWTNNSSSSPGGSESVYSETGLRLEAVSDWSQHSATLRADGSYRRSLSGARISQPEGGVDGEMRFDLGHEYSALATLGYRLREESASDPNAIENTVSDPLRHTLSGSLGLSKDFGRLRFAATGTLVRDVYGDAELESGTILTQHDRNATLATVALRAGYEISPALRPFVEGEIGRRLYDERLDDDGYARSADTYALRAGTEIDLGDKLRGEISAGWLTERPDDERLDPISGATMEGSLAWSPQRGTTVELTAGTQVENATAPGDSGSLLYTGSVAVNRQLRADLTGRALAGLDWRDYSAGGSDLVMRGEVSLTWWMNRYLGVTGRASHEIQKSTLPDRDYSATSLYLGMTLQR